MKKRWIALLLIAVMAVSLLAGCNTAPGKETTAPTKGTEPPATQGTEAPATEAPTIPYEDLPTLNILFVHGYTYESDDNVIWREVAQRVGAKIHIIGADTDKFNTMLASGEGYDIIMTTHANMKAISEGGSLVALDDLLEEKGPNILKNAQEVIKHSKMTYSDDSGALYWLRYELAHNGQRVQGKTDSAGQIRWDLYKAMGYPEVNSQEEFLQMLKNMNDLYPKTADGKTISGIAIPSDKLDQALYSPFYLWNGVQKSGTTCFYTWEDMTYENRYDPDGIFWKAIDFYRAANKLGILDPDSFAMTEADLKAKASEGRLLYITASNQAGTMAEGQGFMALPRTWGKSYFATTTTDLKGIGNFAGGFAINKNTELLDECMKFLDLIHSEEGANLIYNGIEGVHYTVDENGVRSLTQETLDMYINDRDTFEKTGLGTAETSHFCALAQAGIASDGKTLFLVKDASLFQTTLTAIEKDYCAYYGVDYPIMAQIQNIAKYNMNPGGYDSLVAAFLPKPTEDITRIEKSLKEYSESVAADLIYASDADYAALAAKVQAEFENLGLSTVNEYYQDNWDTAYDKAAAYK